MNCVDCCVKFCYRHGFAVVMRSVAVERLAVSTFYSSHLLSCLCEWSTFAFISNHAATHLLTPSNQPLVRNAIVSLLSRRNDVLLLACNWSLRANSVSFDIYDDEMISSTYNHHTNTWSSSDGQTIFWFTWQCQKTSQNIEFNWSLPILRGKLFYAICSHSRKEYSTRNSSCVVRNILR